MEKFWYLATPYTKFPGGRERAYEEACKVAAALVLAGWKVFCPIAHAHPLDTVGKLGDQTHDFWTDLDRPFMDAAEGLLVVKMDGWDTSRGVLEEIDIFTKAGKPTIYMEWSGGQIVSTSGSSR